MKKLWGLALLLTLLLGVEAHAQSKVKIGYVSKQAILLEMPQKDSVTAELEKFRNELGTLLQEQQLAFQEKVNKLQSDTDMSPAIRELRTKELQEEQARLQNTGLQFEQQLGQREQEMLTPLVELIDKAIKDVAKEQGFSHVIDNTAGIVIYSVDGSDISDAVKAKLGIAKK